MLRKIGLIKSLRLELQVSSKSFVEQVSRKLFEAKSRSFLDSPNQFPYSGKIDSSKVDLNYISNQMWMKYRIAKIVGSYKDQQDKTIIDVEINVWKGRARYEVLSSLFLFAIFFAILLIVYFQEGTFDPFFSASSAFFGVGIFFSVYSARKVLNIVCTRFENDLKM